MVARSRLPIDKSIEGRQKQSQETIDRLQKERYAIPIYEIGVITDLLYREMDPEKQKTADVVRIMIVEPFSFDPMKNYGTRNIKDDVTMFNNEEITSYKIGVRRDYVLSKMLKNGDLIEIELVNNEITKRNNIDGFYRSTISPSQGIWNYLEGYTLSLVESYNDKKNNLISFVEENFPELTQAILSTKKLVDSYEGGKITGKIEVISLEGEEVEVNTAKAYIEMKKAALKDGVRLGIQSGYRSMQEQITIYNERYEPDYQGTGGCKKEKKGENISGIFQKAIIEPGVKVAAYPGCSNHQNGKALDLWNSPANVRWLRANARRFGFENTVASENHHWEYTR